MTPQVRQWIAGSESASVQQQDRLAALLGDVAELGEQGRRERVTALAPQVDDPHRRQLPAEPAAELEPLERGPALGPRRRASEDGDGPLERRPLGRDRSRVVAGVGLLLVGRVVLLVDADQPEAAHRCEDRGARADDDAGFPGGDPLALVAALGLRQPRVEQRDPLAEAGPEAADRLRGECDLGHQHDRAEATLERGGAGLEVDLGLAAAGRAVEQVAAAAAVHRRDDRAPPPPTAPASARRARARRPVPQASLGARRAGAPARRDELERASRRRAVVAGEPERQLDERRRQLVEDGGDRAPPRRPAAAARRSETTTPRTRDRPNGTETTAPQPTSSGTS